MSTEDPQINIDRIADRVAHGGHDVATEAVIKRYNKVMGYLPTIFTLTDTLTVYDNSGSVPCAVPFKDGKNVYLLNMDNKCRWIEEHLLNTIVGNPNYAWFYLSNQESQLFINQYRQGHASLGLMNIK